VISIEAHVRVEHLNRPEDIDDVDEEDRDHEEEFYYTEVEAEGERVVEERGSSRSPAC